MTVYFALWIPTLKVGAIPFVTPPERRKIQDNSRWNPYYLWGEVDRASYNFTLRYSQVDDSESAKIISFVKTETNNMGFIIYSADLPDDDEGDMFIRLLKTEMTPSLYHFIKAHFHDHVHHESEEDAILTCLHSDQPLSLNTAVGMRQVAKHYLDCYSQKISDFYNDARRYHERARVLIANVFMVSKGIGLLSSTIRNARKLEGEYEYCEFLMKHYNEGRAQDNKTIRDNMSMVRHEMETVSFDYQLCINAFSVKFGLYGIMAGVAGILVSTGGIVYSCCSETDLLPIIQKNDSIASELKNERLHSDSIYQVLHNDQERQMMELKKQEEGIEAIKKLLKKKAR